MSLNIPQEYRYNQCIKSYPNGLIKVITWNYNIYSSVKQPVNRNKRINVNGDNVRSDSLKRARDKVFDICYLNDFNYFVTFTLDKTKISRVDVEDIKIKLKNWLKNNVKRNNLKYVIVPEYHSDGESIHFHGLISGDLIFTDSGKKTVKGQTIFNLDNWKYGFTTAIPVYGSKGALVNYICKYITKDSKMIFGNYYYAGGGIVRDPVKTYDYVDYTSAQGREYNVFGNSRVKYYDFKVGE